jgi:ribA/ribD-fused uncharacterized protein
MIGSIVSFSGNYRFLSNYYPVPPTPGGRLQFPTVEHAFQAAKTTSQPHQFAIINEPHPGRAKRIGRRVPLRPDWETITVNVMLSLLRWKFQGDYLRSLLLATGDAELIEGNTWNDRFWGQCPVGVGENMLGKLLMQVRSEVSR